MNTFNYPEEICFAYREGKKNECGCLNVCKCIGKECSSYKTKAQVESEEEKCKERIRNLDQEMKLAIASAYDSCKWLKREMKEEGKFIW